MDFDFFSSLLPHYPLVSKLGFERNYFHKLFPPYFLKEKSHRFVRKNFYLSDRDVAKIDFFRFLSIKIRSNLSVTPYPSFISLANIYNIILCFSYLNNIT